MTIHPHHHRALVAYLRLSDFDGASADAAFAAMQPLGEGRTDAVAAPRELRRTRFLTAEKLASLRPKDIARLGFYIVVSDEELAAFPTGLPGFPNKILRPWFDAAWMEARE